ncbi:MAG: integrase arm-type DNA-binding domain-containing protein, partial [Hyphomicrobiaceae bacterium]
MPRQLDRLSARKVATLKTPGMHADGGSLYLRISAGKNAGRRWVFLYRRPADGKRCEIGLGGTTAVPLAIARKKAAEARAHLADGC